MKGKHLPLLVASLALLTSVAQAGILVVGPGGFANIQAAVDAAQPGDTVLVSPGTHAGFTVRRGIRVLGPGPQKASIDDVTIEGVPEGEQLVLSGLALDNMATKLVVKDCLGTVVLHDLKQDNVYIASGIPDTAVSVTSCADVHLLESYLIAGIDYYGDHAVVLNWYSRVSIANCMLRGNKGLDSSYATGQGATALLAFESEVLVSRSELRGGTGDVCQICDGGPGNGGDAVRVNEANLWVLGGPGSTIQGGAGEYAGAIGGYGIIAEEGSTVVVQEDATVLGGPLSLGDSHLWAPFDLDRSSLVSEPVPFATVALEPKQGALGGSARVLCNGAPGEPVAIASSLDLGSLQMFGGIFGTLVLDPGSLFLAGVLLDGSGQASLGFTVPPIPALEAAVVFVQTLQLGPNPALSNLAILPIVR